MTGFEQFAFGFLMSYSLVSMPLILWAVWRSVRSRRQAQAVEDSKISPEMLKLIENSFAGEGIVAHVHEVPKDALEAIIMHSSIIMTAIGSLDRKMETWFQYLKQKGEESRRNEATIMRAEEKVVQGVTQLAEAVGKQAGTVATPEPARIETFVHTLEYARDKFAKTAPQKKAIDTIISNIKITHDAGK